MKNTIELQSVNEKPTNGEFHEIPMKQPKRILHFSDGTLEEFSDDDEVDGPAKVADQIDESTMTWGPWMMYKATQAGSTIIYGCDYVGETLASFLGITTPKYSYEMDQHNKMLEEKAKLEEEDKATATFVEKSQLQDVDICITEQVKKF